MLLVLTFMNTVLLGLYVLGPQLIEFGKGQWAARQQRQADAAKEVTARQTRTATAAGQAACLAYDPGTGRLAYAEDVDGAARLRRDGGTIADADAKPPPPHAAAAVAAADPACLAASGLRTLGLLPGSVVFLHQRDAGRGPRLVVVTLRVNQSFISHESPVMARTGSTTRRTPCARCGRWRSRRARPTKQWRDCRTRDCSCSRRQANRRC